MINTTHRASNGSDLRLKGLLCYSLPKVLMLTAVLVVSSITGSKAQQITMDWETGFDGMMDSAYPSYQLGSLVDEYTTGNWRVTNTILLNDKRIYKSSFYSRGSYVEDSKYPGFAPSGTMPDTEFRIGKNFNYGTWYMKGPVANSSTSFMFVPPAESFPGLSAGDVVKSTFRYDLFENNAAIAGQEITVTISIITGSIAVWSDGIQTDFEGHAVLEIESGATYNDLRAKLRSVKPRYAFFRLNSSSEWINGVNTKAGDFRRSTDEIKESLPDDFDKDASFAYGSTTFTYGFWVFDGSILLFRPNNDNLATLPAETIVEYVLGLNIIDAKYLTTSWFRVTLQKSGISLSWLNGESGNIADSGSDSYDSISGTARILFPTTGSHTLNITGRDSSMSMTDIESTSSSEQGYSSEVVTKYGKWLWQEDDSGFRFDPDANAINQLVDGDSESSTLHVQFSNSAGETSHEATIAVSFTGVTNPMVVVSIASDAGNSDGTEGTGVTIGHDFEYTLTRTGSADSALPVSLSLTRLDMNMQQLSSSCCETIEVTIPIGESSWNFSSSTYNQSQYLLSGVRFYKWEVVETTPSTYGIGTDKTVLFKAKDNRGSAISATNPKLSIAADFMFPNRVGGTASFTVTASDGSNNVAPATPLTVNFKIDSSDFIAASVDLTDEIELSEAAGAKISIPITDPDESTDDPDGTIAVSLKEGAGYVLANSPDNKASVSVTDDAVTLGIAGTSVSEGDAGDTVELEFTVSLSSVLTGNVSFDWSTSDGTATGGADAIVTGADFVTQTGGMGSISSGGGSTTLKVAVVPDDAAERDETLTVTLSNPMSDSSSDGTPTLDPASVTVTILDDDSPELSISDAADIVEGDRVMAMFPITIETQPAALAVNYTPSNILGDFLGGDHDMQKTHTFNQSDFTPDSGSYRAMLPVAVQNDEQAERNGSFRVTLNAPSTVGDYRISTTDGSGVVNVSDDDGGVPFVNLASEYWIEGASEVTIYATATPAPESNLTVTMSVEWYGGGTGTLSATILAGRTVSTSVSVSYHEEYDVYLDEGTDYNRGENWSLDSPEFARPANPQVRIDVLNSLATVSETKVFDTVPGKVTFRITAQPAPSSDLNVSVHVTQTGDFIDATAHPITSNRHETSVTIATTTGASASADLEISLEDDLLDEADGSVTATIQADSSYHLVDILKSRTVAVTDDDVPVLSLGDIPTVNIGGRAAVTVVSDIRPWQAIPVAFAVENTTGAFLDPANTDASPKVLSFAGSAPPYTATIAVATQADPNETSGAIAVSLTDNTDSPGNFSVGTPNSRSIAVSDQPSTLPTITVSGPTTPVVEADEATRTYTFSLTGQTSENVSIAYAVSLDSTAESGDYTLRSDSPLTISGGSGNKTVSLSIVVVNDEVYEGDETIVLDLTATNATFSAGGNAHVLTITIADDEKKPRLSIADPNLNVTQGAAATVRVKSSVQSESAISVGYTATDIRGNFFDAAASGPNPMDMTFKSVDSEFIGELEIGTRSSSTFDQYPGEIRVVLDTPQSAVGYTIDDSAKTSSISVVEERVPVISISAINAPVTEGEVIEIVLESNPVPANDIDVGFRVTQTGDNLVWPVSRTVRFNRGSRSVSLKLSTISNPDSTDSGMVSVVVADGDGYEAGNSVSVEIMKPAGGMNGTKYSVASSVIQTILLQIPPTPPGESSVVKPMLSISAIGDTIEEGESAAFAISASHAVSSRFQVKVRLGESGDFINGPMDRSLDMEAGNSETEFAVATDNDDLAEPDGRITATIQAGSDYLVGTENTAQVTVSDILDRQHRKTSVSTAMNAILPDLLAHSTARTLAIADNRIMQGFSGNPATSIELNGKHPAMTALQSSGEALNGRGADWRSLIDDSSFTLALYPEGSETSLATVWGVGDKWSHSQHGNGAQHSWDGESHTGHFGFDARVGPGMLAGMAMSVSQSEVGYGLNGGSGMSFDSMATGFHPYLGMTAPDGNSRMQIVAGYGENRLELKQEEYLPEVLQVHYDMVAIGGSSSVYSTGSFSGLQNLELSVTGEAWHASQFVDSVEGVTESLQVEASHVRIAVEESHDHHFGNFGTLSPSVSIGLRGDGRNERSVFGLDATGSLEYGAFDGLEVLSSGKSLLSGLNRTHAWEIESSLQYDSENDGKGVQLKMARSWSEIHANAERFIWGSELTDNSTYSIGNRAGGSIEIGYGFEVLDGSAMITPYSAFDHTVNNGSELRVGSRLTTKAGIELGLEAVRNDAESGIVGHEYNLTGGFNW